MKKRIPIKRKPKGSIEANNVTISIRIPGFMLKKLREISGASNNREGIAGVVRELLTYYLFPYSPEDLIREFIEMDRQGKIPGGIIERYRYLLDKMGPSFEQYGKFYDRFLWERKRFDEVEKECEAKLKNLKELTGKKNT